jgi:hypothetical protein
MRNETGVLHFVDCGALLELGGMVIALFEEGEIFFGLQTGSEEVWFGYSTFDVIDALFGLVMHEHL